MYNRYINFSGPQPQPPNDSFQYAEPETAAESQAQPSPGAEGTEHARGGLSGLKNLLGSNLKLPDINGDTLLLLVLVYFLVVDPDDKISDTVLIIAALFLLGL